MRARLLNGYTLIELVVVAAILGVIGVVSVSLFLSTLSGGGKSSGTNEVRSNGDFAITQMERMIRNAVRIESCSANSITILNPDDGITTFTGVGNAIASNSGILTGTNVQLDGGINFSCIEPDDGSPSSVNISFILNKSNQITNRHEDVQVEFSTSVQLRAY